MRRDAIIGATIRVVGGRGYRATTVGDIIAAAGVTRTTFYKHFADRHKCFLAAFDLVAERVVAAVEKGCASERSWTARARGGLASLVELFVAEPELARVAVVEPVLADAETRRRQLDAIERCARMLERGQDDGADRSSGDKVAGGIGLMAVGAATGLIFDEIQAGRATELSDRLPDLLFALLVPYVGPKKAVLGAFSASYS